MCCLSIPLPSLNELADDAVVLAPLRCTARRGPYQAWKAFGLWQENPAHPGLLFKHFHGTEPVYSVRISRGYRALGLMEGETVTWFWIGSHENYERLISRM